MTNRDAALCKDKRDKVIKAQLPNCNMQIRPKTSKSPFSGRRTCATTGKGYLGVVQIEGSNEATPN